MDEQQKQRVLISVLAFNLTVIAVCVVLWMMDAFANRSTGGAFWMTVVVAAPIGAVVGVAVFYLTGLAE